MYRQFKIEGGLDQAATPHPNESLLFHLPVQTENWVTNNEIPIWHPPTISEKLT